VKSLPRPVIVASVIVVAAILVVGLRAIGAEIAGIVVAVAAWLDPKSASPDKPRESENKPEPGKFARRSRAVLATPARYFLILGIVLIAGGVWAIVAHASRSSLYWKGPVNLSANGNFAAAFDYRPPHFDKGTGLNDLVLNGSSETMLVTPGSSKVAIWHSSETPSAEQCTAQLTAAGSSPKIEQREIRAGFSICLFTRAGRLAVIHINQISSATAPAVMRGLSAGAFVYNIPSN
jgi:hypothetical protein